MKHLYLFILIFFVAGNLNAQNLNGRTITIVGDSANIMETGVVRVNNLSSQNYAVKVKRIEGNLVPGSANYFCWTICYAPHTNESPTSMNVNANDYNDNFHGYYDPAMNPGESTVTYVFFNSGNVNDSVWFTVNYKTSGVADTLSDPYIDFDFLAGVNENKMTISGPAYPNPSTEFVNFNLKKNEKIDRVEVINLLGEKVIILQPNNLNKLSIPVSELTDGIYFCNFIRNGEAVSTERFTVVH